MKKTLIMAGIVISLTVSGIAASAADNEYLQAGNVRYIVPDDWTRTEKDGTVSVMPRDLPEGQTCMISITPGTDLTGDFPRWFDAMWAAATQGSKVIDGGEVVAGRTPEGYDYLMTASALESGDKNAIVILYGVHTGQRAELAMFLTDRADLYQTHRDDIETFLTSMRFSPVESPQTAGVRRTAGADKKAMLDGVYVAYRTAMMPDPRGRVDVSPKKDFFVFFPDGAVYWKMPQEGPDGFDYERARQETPQLCGTYRMTKDQVMIQWETGGVARMARGKGKLIFDRDTYLSLPKYNDLRLEGTYLRADGTAPERQLTFRKDGTFQDTGAIGVVGLLYIIPAGDNRFTPALETGEPGAGTYRIRNNTLLLSYADGRQRKISFCLLPDEAKKDRPGFIVLNTYELARQ